MLGGTVSERSFESKKKANYQRQCRFEGDGKSNGRRNVAVSYHLLTTKTRFLLYQSYVTTIHALFHHTFDKQTLLFNSL